MSIMVNASPSGLALTRYTFLNPFFFSEVHLNMFLYFVVPICLLFRNVLFATLRFLARNQRISIKMAKEDPFCSINFCFSSNSPSPSSFSANQFVYFLSFYRIFFFSIETKKKGKEILI